MEGFGEVMEEEGVINFGRGREIVLRIATVRNDEGDSDEKNGARTGIKAR